MIDVTGEVAQIVAAVVAAVGIVIVAVITTRTRQHTRQIRDQVENHHNTNLREELDSRHAETAKWFRDVRRDLGGIREELRGMRETDRAQERRIQRLEDIEITDQGRNRS